MCEAGGAVGSHMPTHIEKAVKRHHEEEAFLLSSSSHPGRHFNVFQSFIIKYGSHWPYVAIEHTKGTFLRASIMALCVKLLSARLASHPVGVPAAPFLIQLPSNTPGKEVTDDPNACGPAFTCQA